MKISIITATFNSGTTLRDTMRSVLSQDYSDYEHIIVDGGSKDNTIEIVKDFEPEYNGRLRWVSEQDNGIYDAMNKGIRMAKGDVIGILNSDDFYADDSVLNHISKEIEDVDIVYGDLVFVDISNTSKVIRTWTGSQYRARGFFKGWHPAHPTFYARKILFDKYGCFDISFDVSADFELMLRFIEKYKSSNRYIPHTLVRMRMGGESTGSIKKILQGNKNVLRAFEKNGFKTPTFYMLRRLAPKALNLIKTKLGLV